MYVIFRRDLNIFNMICKVVEIIVDMICVVSFEFYLWVWVFLLVDGEFL